MQNFKIGYQIRQVLKENPGLFYNEQSRMFSGTILVDEEDNYCITLDINPFPIKFPVVKEINERIKRGADNHKYSDNSCCLTVPVKEQFLLRKGLIKTIPQFINKIVIPFFQNNSYREINGEYKDGEYSHGLPGILEGYSDILGIKDLKLTIKLLIKYLKGEKFGLNTTCFCGSNKKYKDCHRHRFENLKFIDKELILSDLDLLIAPSKFS
jgi:hypothetical protein